MCIPDNGPKDINDFTLHDTANHHYLESYGLLESRKAIVEWYKQRFGVTLDPDKEVMPLIGTKGGIAHIALCFIDPGDVALVLDPGYPVYSLGTWLVTGILRNKTMLSSRREANV